MYPSGTTLGNEGFIDSLKTSESGGMKSASPEREDPAMLEHTISNAGLRDWIFKAGRRNKLGVSSDPIMKKLQDSQEENNEDGN